MYMAGSYLIPVLRSAPMGRVSVDSVTLTSIEPLSPGFPSIVESYCVPDFDSPSVFARILDKDKVLPTNRMGALSICSIGC